MWSVSVGQFGLPHSTLGAPSGIQPMSFTITQPRHYRLKAGDTVVSGSTFDDCGEVAFHDSESGDWVVVWRGKPEVTYAVTVAVKASIEAGKDPAGLSFRWVGNRVQMSTGEFFRRHA